uniref:Sodefrin-like factor n=1 Tax=Panagrolaimus superbus TaxID=310955 RepID=A0A914YYH0_9BILA
MNHIYFLLLFIPTTFGFECYTCNSDPNSDDSGECIDQKETCQKGIESCSMVTYLSKNDEKIHTRKFCTSAGTPIYQYLLFFPGSALCQNIETKNDKVKFGSELLPPPTSDFSLNRAKRVRRGESASASLAGAPAPPHTHSDSLLCVCSTQLCNGGSFTEVLNRSMKNHVQKVPDLLPLSNSKSFNHIQE